MSTYLTPGQTAHYEDCPPVLREFLNYALAVRSLSLRTVNAYYIDLRTFFRFLQQHRTPSEIPIDEQSIVSISLDFVKLITKEEIYEFIYYLNQERNNSASTRARKLCSIKAFFKYCVTKKNYFTYNPSLDIDSPALKKTLPKYLSLEECIELLRSVNTDFTERDFCMITLFLNCGMRRSEVVGMIINDFKVGTVRFLGKGNKERTVYLTPACQESLARYLSVRQQLSNLKGEKALFVSKRTGKRLTNRRVEQIVAACLQQAGLDGKGYSPHKLRHTAATLMYRSGEVDMLALQEILGHASVSTTQIYTHISKTQLEKAVGASPLANIKIKPRENKKN
ncbi:MAG: tyrosine recombinase XerC [Pygmaiobacter sp.]